MTEGTSIDEVSTVALSQFGISPSNGWRVRHLRTMNNSVFSVGRSAETPEWVLRRHRPGGRSTAAISAELSLLSRLDQHLPDAVTVARPGRTPTGEQLVTVAGQHYSLLSWLPGAPKRPDSGLDRQDAWLLGHGLGLIHTIVDDCSLQPPVTWNAETLFVSHPGLLDVDPSALRDLLPASDLEFFNTIAARTAEVFDHCQDWGLIHGDYILGNCHWQVADDQQSHLGVLDFDDFGYGPRLFDLGAMLGNLADFPNSWPDLADEFLRGYRDAHPLPEDAEAQLPLMMAARHTSHCLWAIGHRELGQEWIRTHLAARIELARSCLAVRL